MDKRKNKITNIINLILFFFLLSFVGWIIEVSIKVIFKGILTNGGAFQAYFIPIYGYGCLMMLYIKNRVKSKLIPFALISFITIGIFEYISSYVLEKLDHKRLWDYSKLPLNINGRVCLIILALFVLGGYCAVYILEPNFIKYISKYSLNIRTILAFILLTIYTYEMFVTFTLKQ